MLILPVEQSSGRRTAPWVCILLIIANTLIFAVNAHRDNQLEVPLSDQQLELLAEYEAPLLLDWLSRQDSNTYADAVAMDDRGQDFMFAYGWFNQAFAQHVHEQWTLNAPPQQWVSLRSNMEDWIARFSSYRWGLIPDSPTATAFVSSLFMHGDWFHLLGNMVWLIIFGIAMERYWGSLRFSISYLLSGMGAGLLFILVDPDGGMPLVGASGAISGIMGLYAGTYRLRKVEFFYTLGFVFGSFRAPALVLFPVWLGWELVQAFTTNTNVAYMAHAGGLISGLLLAFLLPYSKPNAHSGHDAMEKPAEHDVPEACQKLAEELRFAEAQQRCQQWLERYPTSKPLWGFFLEMGLRQKRIDNAMVYAMKTLNNQPQKAALLAWLWQEYEALGGNIAQLPPSYRLLLAELAMRQQRTQIARGIINGLESQNWQHPRMDRLRQQLDPLGLGASE
ncbi:rhomboid family intramembrane serine protease [Alcanivorax sp.]|uniref:rhomboid family intramembrane serine protease n=1 Tax=Alcanivorax sp. TaxID=1872427 RepID=UPI0025BE0467|nr:rhomboid family intramembrane serine protease [Alcanivorax sp.]